MWKEVLAESPLMKIEARYKLKEQVETMSRCRLRIAI